MRWVFIFVFSRNFHTKNECKISDFGYDRLTKREKHYLYKYSENDQDSLNFIEKSLKDREERISDFLDYDPRKDDFFDGVFNGKNDDEMEESKYEILWEELENDDLEDFIKDKNIKNLNTEINYENLPKDIKSKFINWINSFMIMDL